MSSARLLLTTPTAGGGTDMAESKSILTFKYRLYPTVRQTAELELHLREAARLYNAALQERRDAWRLQRKRISFYDQDRQLKEIRAAGDIGIASFSCSRDVLKRVDSAFAAFFRRLRAGKKPGFPRFRSSARYNTLGVPRFGERNHLSGNRVRIQGIGQIKAKIHRQPVGLMKSGSISRQAGRWYVCIQCECHPSPLPYSDESVGIDVGLTSFAVLSDGTTVAAPRLFRQSERRLRRRQRHTSRCQRGSGRIRRARLAVERAHERVRRQRADFHHKLSRTIVNSFGSIAVEDLDIAKLSRSRFAKSIHDAGWSAFTSALSYKAANAGRELVKVNPRGTSQTCLCGARVPKALSDRWHHCSECGLSAPRDLVSAKLIEWLGHSQRTLTDPIGPVVRVASE